MRFPQLTFIANLGFCAALLSAQPAPAPAQAPAGPVTTSAGAPATANVAQAASASLVLQPALSQAQSTLGGLKIDKWKKGSVRDEAGGNVNSLLHDLQTNLPPLLAAADAEPGSLSRAMPLMKHLDAFYDVLLRVEEASRVSAPGDQINVLQQTLLDVNKARIALDDQLQAQAASQEKAVFDLRTQLKTQKDAAASLQAKVDAAATAKTEPCKPAAPAKKKRRTTTTAMQPGAATTTPAKPGSSTPATQTAKPSPSTPATQKPQ